MENGKNVQRMYNSMYSESYMCAKKPNSMVSTNVKKLYCTKSLLYVLNNQGYQRKDDL